MSNIDDLTKKISDLLGDMAHATSNILPQAWKLLVDYERAVALASLIGSACSIVSACLLYIFANRLLKSAIASYKEAEILYHSSRCGVHDTRPPLERASVVVPGLSGILMIAIGFLIMCQGVNELPMAIARYYYPDSFAAQQLLLKTSSSEGK